MNQKHIAAMLAVSALAFSSGSMAMSQDEYKAAKKAIAAEHKSAKASCNAFCDNARDICRAVAKGREKVAKAKLDARYKPSIDADYAVNIARGDADYAISLEKCDDKAGNLKDLCVEDAKAARMRAESDANAQLKTSDAITRHDAVVIDANLKAKEKSEEARQDAAASQRDSNDSVAKCAAEESKCINEAKLKFGK
ncbi:MAG: hypothetical protein PHP85_03415 [Gallionella sp.]|nr:hypothetical protein [Gallionella sp.]